MRAFVFALLASSLAVFADTNSDLYMRCPQQRQNILKYGNLNGTTCQNAIAEVANCCALKTCRVAGIAAGATRGNVEGGQLLILGLEALAKGIQRNVEICNNGSLSVGMNCSKDRGATPQDRAYMLEFNKTENALEACLKAELVTANAQVLQAGGVVTESGGTPTFRGGSTADQQMTNGLMNK